MPSYRMLTLLLFILINHAVIGENLGNPSGRFNPLTDDEQNSTFSVWWYGLVIVTAILLLQWAGPSPNGRWAPCFLAGWFSPWEYRFQRILRGKDTMEVWFVVPKKMEELLGGYLTNERRPDSYCRFVNKDRNKPEMEVYTEWADLPAHVADQLFNQSVREGNILW